MTYIEHHHRFFDAVLASSTSCPGLPAKHAPCELRLEHFFVEPARLAGHFGMDAEVSLQAADVMCVVIEMATEADSGLVAGLRVACTFDESDPVELLSMALRDKTSIAMAVGSPYAWTQAVTPTIVTVDAHSRFDTPELRAAVQSIGALVKYPSAKDARTTIEVVLSWMRMMARGSAGSVDASAVAEDPPMASRGRVDLKPFTDALVRGVCAYNSWVHARLDAFGERVVHKHPVPPLSPGMLRRTFGRQTKRHVDGAGVITILGVRYAIAGSVEESGAFDVKYDHWDVSAISVKGPGGKWREAGNIDGLPPGVSARELILARSELANYRDPVRHDPMMLAVESLRASGPH